MLTIPNDNIVHSSSNFIDHVHSRLTSMSPKKKSRQSISVIIAVFLFFFAEQCLDESKNMVTPISVLDEHLNMTYMIFTSKDIIDQTRVILSVYDQQPGLFDDEHYRLVTPMLSLTMDKPPISNTIGSFAKMYFQLDDNLNEKHLILQCAHWNINGNSSAQWSTQGCQLTERTHDRVTCLCDYFTHYAVLMV
jgi:hypothetical protein